MNDMHVIVKEKELGERFAHLTTIELMVENVSFVFTVTETHYSECCQLSVVSKSSVLLETQYSEHCQLSRLV